MLCTCPRPRCDTHVYARVVPYKQNQGMAARWWSLDGDSSGCCKRVITVCGRGG